MMEKNFGVFFLCPTA